MAAPLRRPSSPKPKPHQSANRLTSAELRMRLGPDEAFEKIAGQLLAACDKVDCSKDDYLTGLRYILGEIEVAIQAAKETMA